MLSVLRNWLQREERERERKLDLIERENNFLDHELSEERQQQQQKGDSSCMQNIIKSKQEMDNSTWQEADDKSCSSRQGVVTELHSKGGVIDTYIPFDGPSSDHIYHQLVKGSVVEYLAYKKANEEFLKVVKILKVIEQGWGESITDSTITAAVESLKLEDSTYFKTQERIVQGMVIERLQSTIEVDTSSGRQKFDLENVELTFVPKMGDYVTLECAVQLDDGYVDKQGEILQLLKVFPTRILSNENCRVERCFPEFAVLGENAYLLRENFPSGTELHMGDYVLADLIECVYSKFTHRAIKVMPQESNFLSMKKEKTFSADRNVVITGATRFITTELWEKHKITLKLQNNSNRKLELHEVQLDHGHASQIRVIEPLTKTCLGIDGQLSVILEVEARCIGEWAEKYTLDFKKFKVVRCFKIFACETQKEADDAERRLLAAESFVVSGRSEAQRNRSYAKNVWANTLDVVRGESGLCRQRFVLTRIGNFDVPESLRNVYLRDCRPTEVLDDLERLYPCSTEALCMANYVQRFRFFLHLEEIEFFVCIRNFDRDRAHMERDGEYLSLTIENLAERRPSLVIGDTVCAINPWKDVTSDNKSYSGCIHKVLFDRVLLKFHPNFQEKYNGEDYRLEFYFSRFSLRKQHHAINQVVTSLGEQFLFPSKVMKRAHPQLQVRLVDGEDMYLFDTKLEWYNKSLNSIQKRAVFNILRGEAMNLPYVIFGPPGTGKTVTLVEAVLQMVRNLQSCRILVATPSNSAADLITRRIIASNALAPGDFVRIVSHNLIEKELIPTELMPYCATLDVGIDGSSEDNMLVTESGLKLRCKWKFIGAHRVSIGTCATLGNFMQMSFPGGHFTHLFLDEAGQSTEPEAMMPAALLSKDRGQVILSGDPHQLQPIILSKYGRHCGFDLSLLERLLATQPYAKDLVGYPDSSGYNPLVLTKLLHNYRALPSIMATYSKLFYDDELISMVSEEDSRERTLLGRVQSVLGTGMPRNHGVCFVGIMGQNMQDRDSPSWYNPLEAREVYLMVISLYRCAVTPDQIGILTPYTKQVKTIRGLFMGTNVAMPKVGSAEEFQGQERDIMLISTVRSSETLLVKDAHLSLGFVRCHKRLNVAISRARAFLVVYGNPHLLSVDDNWRHLITFCANNNAYFGCELPQSFVPEESDGEADDSSDSYHEVSD
ncbi:probable RNA helicase armi [Drosophila subobscura]|uniref:probable RNA helicase armi n=1 Tax=Drosophila subobscura TaxID=7241 RepID=UPI00155ABABB|nr:probable RNA helicase armi [Drosophila subobscura]